MNDHSMYSNEQIVSQFTGYNPWWSDDDYNPNLKDRPLILSQLEDQIDKPDIVFVTGLRRIGKTSLMKLLIVKMVKKYNINPNHILYLSVDNYLLSNLIFFDLINKFRIINNISVGQKIYIFFDEVTYQKDYEVQLKNLYDLGNIKIYASSSSASVIKSKKPLLTGRHVTIEVQPLNFWEYLDFNNIRISKNDPHLITPYFEKYLIEGGIPEYIIKKDPEYLKTVIDDIIFKDIQDIYGVKDSQVLKDFFLLLMERGGKIVSINKLANILNISPDTASRYLNMFVDTFLVYLVPRYGTTNEQILAPKKLYVADMGIRTLFTGLRDKGSLFENYVFNLIRKYHPKYIYNNQNEIDFIINKKHLIEVKYMTDIVGKQKVFFDNYPIENKYVITNLPELEALIKVLQKD